MDRDKKQIILAEIEHWRRSKLLPEQYCDFLQNLYSDEKVKPSHSLNPLGLIQQGNLKMWSLSFGIISFFFFIVFYFSSFSWPLQMGSALLLSSVCYIASALYRTKKPLFSLAMAGIGSLLMLGLGSWMITLQGWDKGAAIPMLVAVCGIFWVAVGFMLNFGILSYCGIACTILLYAMVFGRLHTEVSWSLLQAVWLPISAVFYCLTWLSHHRLKEAARVFFAVSLTLWFMPEADALLLRGASFSGMPWLILLKIVFMFLILFIFRKKWVVWIAS